MTTENQFGNHQNQYQQIQQQQQVQHQQLPPNLGPAVQHQHPHTVVNVPPVMPPAPLGTGGTATPEQILADAQRTQQQAGINPVAAYQQPQVQYAPSGGANPTSQITQHPQMPPAPQIPANPQMPMNPQMQPQMQPQPAPEYGVDTKDFPNVPEDVLGDLVTQAEENNVPAQNLNQYVQGELGRVAEVGGYEQYQSYNQKFGQLASALGQKFGEQGVQQNLETVKQNILEHGGEPLLKKFQTDPAMLDPEVVTPYLKDKSQVEENPYLKYLQGPTNPAGGGQMVGGGQMSNQSMVQDPNVIQSRIREMYSDKYKANRNTDEWNQEMHRLYSQAGQAKNSQRFGGMGVA